MFGKIHPWRRLGQGFCVPRVFWLLFQFDSLLLVYSGFLLLLDSVLEGYVFLEICAFCPSCPISWHIVVYSNFIILYISVLSIVASSLSFLILFIWVLSLFFFLDESVKACQFCLSFRRTSYWIHWSFELLFSLYVI